MAEGGDSGSLTNINTGDNANVQVGGNNTINVNQCIQLVWGDRTADVLSRSISFAGLPSGILSGHVRSGPMSATTTSQRRRKRVAFLDLVNNNGEPDCRLDDGSEEATRMKVQQDHTFPKEVGGSTAGTSDAREEQQDPTEVGGPTVRTADVRPDVEIIYRWEEDTMSHLPHIPPTATISRRTRSIQEYLPIFNMLGRITKNGIKDSDGIMVYPGDVVYVCIPYHKAAIYVGDGMLVLCKGNEVTEETVISVLGMWKAKISEGTGGIKSTKSIVTAAKNWIGETFPGSNDDFVISCVKDLNYMEAHLTGFYMGDIKGVDSEFQNPETI